MTVSSGTASPSLAEHAYRTLTDQLVTLQIRPGSPLNDEQLARQLGVGRTPVREALKRLEADRLVVAYPRRGTFATEVHLTDLGHVSEVRRQLEPLAAAAAARRASAGDRELLAGLAESAAEQSSRPAVEPVELMRLDLRLHRAVYAATGNPFLESTLISYDNLATRIWCLFLDRLPGLAGHVGEHSALLRAVIDGDAERAAACATDHVTGFEAAIRAVL
ncbi:GntR family transcriptional regulator [Streptacidiphilus carbonis]|uniref:GntR family transcriptional regulator n=1 Tax=Streptacidiphilus carbonis TaxID=105422 RepID=UPI0005A84D65|nr:GntR family transcriptional regulator [Streptacidiphilus carbonis]